MLKAIDCVKLLTLGKLYWIKTQYFQPNELCSAKVYFLPRHLWGEQSVNTAIFGLASGIPILARAKNLSC